MKSSNKMGLIDLCALALLSKKNYYGYDISSLIAQKIDIADGTIYPVLRRLKNDGLVTTYLTEGEGGPPRKYYKLTETGKSEFLTEKNNWKIILKNIDELLED
jgi:PadR family transcriptional regulator, regulatory protein PadR